LQVKPKKIVEIGFNAGHSCKLILDTVLEVNDPEYQSQTKEVYIFDICTHQCVEPNFEILKAFYQKHNINMTLIKGSSFDTLTKFLEDKDQLDFVNIDGCHSTESVINDFYAVRNKIALKGVIYVDDYAIYALPLNFPEMTKAIENLDWTSFMINFFPGCMWGIKTWE